MSSFILKCIALITMVIDHVGAVFFPEHLWIRYIGRIAFPIYAFLIAEGYVHTRSKGKYISRLLLFGLISEVPYDLLFYKSYFNFEHQNILFELAAGVLVILCVDKAINLKHPVYSTLLALGAACIALSSEVLGLSYGLYGIALMLCFWLLRSYRTPAVISLVAITWVFYGIGNLSLPLIFGEYSILSLNSIQMYAVIAGIPLIFYNGTKGKLSMKWFFYIIYPLHLLILLLIRNLMVMP